MTGLSLLLGSACELNSDRLKKALASEVATEREAALERIAAGGDSALVPLALPLLRDRSARVRRRAVSTLGRLGIRTCLGVVARRLEDTDVEVRLATVRALGDSGARAARRPLMTALVDPSMVVRRAASISLESLGMKRSEQIAALARAELSEQIKRLTRADEQLRSTAAKMVGLSGREEGLAPLLKLLEDGSPLVVDQAAVAAGRIGAARALGPLAALATSSESFDRRAAARGLSELARAARRPGGGSKRRPSADQLKRVASILVSLASDADGKVREAALRAMLKTGSTGDEVVCRALSDPVQAVAVQAARLIGDGRQCDAAVKDLCQRARAGQQQILEIIAPLRSDVVDDALLALARRRYETYRRQAVRWISAERWRRLDPGSPGAPVAPPKKHGRARSRRAALGQLLKRFPERPAVARTQDPLLPPPMSRAAVIRAIGVLGDRPRAAGWLATVATEAPPAVRIAAMEAVAGGEAGGDKVGNVRRAALQGLKARSLAVRRAASKSCALLGKGAFATATRLLDDPDFEIRQRAAACIGRLRDTRGVAPLLARLSRERTRATILALATIGDHRATRDLMKLLLEDHPAGRQGERVAIIEALGMLGDRAAAPALERETSHPDWRVRRAAAKALARAWGPRTGQAVSLCQQDYYAAVRDACRSTAKKITSNNQSEP